ncbi:MAG: T9SS type A sorting domain-containing protein [bacterium]
MKKVFLTILTNFVIGICGVTYYGAVECSGIYKTINEGKDWIKCLELPSTTKVNDMSISRTPDGYYLFAACATDDGGNILRSKDYGAYWEILQNLPTSESFSTVLSHPVNQEKMFAVRNAWPESYSELYRSSNYGDNWQLVYTFPQAQIYRLAISNTEPDTMFASGSIFSLGGIPCAAVWRSIDGGENWNIVFTLTPYTIGRDIAVDPSNSRIVYFSQDASEGAVWKSQQSGEPGTWERILNLVSPLPIEIDPEAANYIYVGISENGEPGLVRSSDWGNTWINITPGSLFTNSICIDPSCPQVVFAGGYESRFPQFFSRVYRSTSRGDAWLMRASGLPVAETRPNIAALVPSPLIESEIATSLAFQSPKLLCILSSQKFVMVYRRSECIFANISEDRGKTWRKGKMLGYGDYSCLATDASGGPCAIWQRNKHDFPYPGGELWLSKYDGESWSEPFLLFSTSGSFGAEFNAPSFIVDPAADYGFVTFEVIYFGMNGPASVLYLGKFSINNPSDFELWQLESTWSSIRCEFPSISQGGNYLYIAFQREHKIYRIKWDKINHQIVNRIRVSEDGRFSHHPFVDVQANGVINYVWEDSTTNNIEIYGAYEIADIPHSRNNLSNTPGKSQWPQICKGTTWITWSEFIWPPTDNNWEICYKDMEYEGYQILSQTLEMSKYSHGAVTRSPYWPPPYEPKLTAIWTEGNQAPYEIRAKTVVLPEISYYYVDAGKEEPSPWTVQREGYIQFGPEPEKTIDYHSQKLIYHFPNLNPQKRYRIKLVFYFESQSQNHWKMKIDADNIFHSNLWIKPGEITTLERWLPTACYKDGEIYLNIKKIIGDYALVSQIFIYEYERENAEITKNTQESGILPANQFALSVSPNPCYSRAMIRYALPNQSSAILKIYDASGRLVRQWDYKTIRQSDQIVWNTDDDNGRTLSNGIYFVVLENGKDRLTQKLILIR